MLQPIVLKYIIFEIYHVCRFTAFLKEIWNPEVPDILIPGFHYLISTYSLSVRRSPDHPSNFRILHEQRSSHAHFNIYIGSKACAPIKYQPQLSNAVSCTIYGVPVLKKYSPVKSMNEWIDTFFYNHKKNIFKYCTGEVFDKFALFIKKFYRGTFRNAEFYEWLEDLIKNHGDYYILQSLKHKIVQITTHDHGFQYNAVQRARSRLKDIMKYLDRQKQEIGRNKLMYLDIGASEGNITTSVIDYLGLSKDQSYACDLLPELKSKKFHYAPVVEHKHMPFQQHKFNLITMFMVHHHFIYWKEMVEEIKARAAPGAIFILREHDCTTTDRWIYYDLVHVFYMCVMNDEMTINEMIATYSLDSFCFYDSKYSWKKRFQKEGFEVVASIDLHDKMDAFYFIMKLR